MSHESTNEITCPYCDHEFLDSWDSGVGGCEEEIECESCEETFVVSGRVTYSSRKKHCEQGKCVFNKPISRDAIFSRCKNCDNRKRIRI